jgi:hypothetical protein
MKVKIDLDLPTVPDEAVLYVLARIELVAYKTIEGKWHVKTSKCSMCGKCCYNRRDNDPFPTIDGRCIYLQPLKGTKDKFVCSLGIHRPVACTVGHHEPEEAARLKCTEGFQEVASNM